MAKPLTGGIAPDIVLAPGYIVRVTATDPDTGDTVAGVVVSDVALQVLTVEGDVETIQGPAIIPLFAYASGS